MSKIEHPDARGHQTHKEWSDISPAKQRAAIGIVVVVLGVAIALWVASAGAVFPKASSNAPVETKAADEFQKFVEDVMRQNTAAENANVNSSGNANANVNTNTSSSTVNLSPEQVQVLRESLEAKTDVNSSVNNSQ